MKVLIALCVLFVAVQANPAFRALRARASGLGGGSAPAAAPQQNFAAAQPAQPAAQPAQPAFGQIFQSQPMYQPQPMYQVQPQYQQYQQQQGRYPGAPFAGFQPVQG